MSEVIQPNEGGHDMLKMMLGGKKKNCWWKHLETPILKLVQMLLWLELGGERQVMVWWFPSRGWCILHGHF
jgi:hypothetical protein